MKFILDFFSENYPQILIGMLLFQCVSMFLQFLGTREKIYLLYFGYLMTGVYICIFEFGLENLATYYFDGGNYLIEITSLSFIFYWLFLYYIIDIKKEDTVSRIIFTTSISIYIFIIFLSLSIHFFELTHYVNVIKFSTILTYFPLIFSIYLYIRVYTYYDTNFIKYIIIGSLLGDLIIVPLQFFMSNGSKNIENPYFTLSYLLESVFFSIALSYRQKITASQNLTLKKTLTESQNASLRAQMNPHFINNVLNAINKFIINYENETASYYLTKFSRLMRDILNQSKEEWHDLKTEINTLTKYIEMEALRFDHHFEYKFFIDPTIELSDIKIPPMMLQPFVENAVNHGLIKITGKRNLTIKIDKQQDYIEIQIIDNGVGFDPSDLNQKETQNLEPHGISLVKARIEQHSNIVLLPIQSNNKGTTITLKIR